MRDSRLWCLCEELHRTATDEFVGDGEAKFCGRHVQRSFVQDVRGLLTIERDDHGVQVPLVVDTMGEGSERELAAAAESVEYGAFGGDGIFGGGAVESADDGEDGRIARGVFGV